MGNISTSLESQQLSDTTLYVDTVNAMPIPPETLLSQPLLVGLVPIEPLITTPPLNVPSDISTLDILSKVEALYGSMFNTVLILLGIVFAVMGLIVPVIVWYIQNISIKRQLKEAKDRLREEIKLSKVSTYDELTDQIHLETRVQKQLIKSEIEKLELKLDEIENYSAAMIGHTDASIALADKNYPLACLSLFLGLILYLKSTKNRHTIDKINLFSDDLLDSLSKCNKNEIKDKYTIDAHKETIETFREINSDGQYDELIDEIETAWKSANEREPAEDK